MGVWSEFKHKLLHITSHILLLLLFIHPSYIQSHLLTMLNKKKLTKP